MATRPGPTEGPGGGEPVADGRAVDGAPDVAEGVPIRLATVVWERDVLSMEPVLVRLDVINTSDQPLAVVPPYVNCYGQLNWPLGFDVRDGDGQPILSGWAWGPQSTAPVEFSRRWWLPNALRGPGTPLPPRRPWVLQGGATAFIWLDLSRFYPIEKPGRHDLTLLYRRSPEMLDPPAGPDEAPTRWFGDLDARVGWIAVREPSGRDAEAAAWPLGLRGRLGVVSSEHYDVTAGRLRADLLRDFPDTAHAPYAEFFHAREQENFRWRDPDERADMVALSKSFVADHPEFPLCHQLAVVPALTEWRAIPLRVPMNAKWPAISPGERKTPAEAEAALIHQMSGLGDPEFRQRLEQELWQWRLKRQAVTE